MAITVSNVRFSFVNIFSPRSKNGGEPKYSVTILVPKSDVAGMKAVYAAYKAAVEAGVAKWGGKKPAQIACPIYDGDGVRPNGEEFGPECKGHWVFTASCREDHPPFVVDRAVQPIMDRTEVYSGCYGNVSINFFPYNAAGRKGIGCGLNGLQKVKDGEPLSGGTTAAQAFKPVGTVNPLTGEMM